MRHARFIEGPNSHATAKPPPPAHFYSPCFAPLLCRVRRSFLGFGKKKADTAEGGQSLGSYKYNATKLVEKGVIVNVKADDAK